MSKTKSKTVQVLAYISAHQKDKFRAAYEVDGFPSDSSAIAHLIREYLKNRAKGE